MGYWRGYGWVGGRMAGRGTTETSRKQAGEEQRVKREIKAKRNSDSQATVHRVQAMVSYCETKCLLWVRRLTRGGARTVGEMWRK